MSPVAVENHQPWSGEASPDTGWRFTSARSLFYIQLQKRNSIQPDA